MRVNADFGKAAIAHFDEIDWTASPTPGVDRKLLDRVGLEVARATSIVKYAPKSAFPSHNHDGGEEILVLDGVFRDEHGEYPAGTYFRNPPGTAHAPGSEAGCLLFVKLRQFPAGDTTAIQISTHEISARLMLSQSEACEILYQSPWETVSLCWFPADARIAIAYDMMSEHLILRGTLHFESEVFQRNSWLRLPAGQRLDVKAGEQGCLAWVKQGPNAALGD
jgi:quercetin dioxygenase-like cupin family protein